MQHIVSFLINNKYFLLFLFLEIIAISLTIQSHSYHRSKFINSSNFITGGIYNNFNSFNNYLHLKTYNEQLLEENTKLKNLLSKNNTKSAVKQFTRIDSLTYNNKYTYTAAKVINNEFNKANNRLTINRGSNDKITPELAVVSSKGIVGITTNVSANYAVVMPVINENSHVNVRLKNNSHYGTLKWNGNNYNIVQIDDLPIQTNVKVGDTIITGGRSTIFPEGILVGKIKDFKIKNKKYKIVNVQLFNDMSALYNINIITNLHKQEIKALENE
ncbi:MAG TPA: rod shape-determining protein MreC [Flavobacteriaceae bacterium]|nr:rod shape-determining protein MreC [Flavobacteriaceae bacterium]HIP26146.1 rod shape-determining protein MreC [Flavobacteriaceae bacterium]